MLVVRVLCAFGVNEDDEVIGSLLQPEEKIRLEMADAVYLGIVVGEIDLVEALVQVIVYRP